MFGRLAGGAGSLGLLCIKGYALSIGSFITHRQCHLFMFTVSSPVLGPGGFLERLSSYLRSYFCSNCDLVGFALCFVILQICCFAGGIYIPSSFRVFVGFLFTFCEIDWPNRVFA
jgi:hypothetical protein